MLRGRCEAHKSHRPSPTFWELHHVIPQAWQRWWRPPGSESTSERRRQAVLSDPQLPQDEFDAVMATVDLFDPRTATLCRTGHGNVHWWLVRAMRAYKDQVYQQEPHSEAERKLAIAAAMAAALITARKTDGVFPVRAEVSIARLAMERWVEAGGSCLALAAAGLYGEI